MNITIIHGDLKPVSGEFDRFLHSYRMKLLRTGQYVRSFNLREMQLAGVTGGSTDKPVSTLPVRDDFRYIENALKETDLLVLAATPENLSVVFVLKLLRERLSIKKHAQGAPYHLMKQADSENIPMIGLILNTDAGAGEHDMLLNRLAGERLAADLHTVFSFCTTTDGSSFDAACKTFQSLNYRQYLEKTCDDLILGVG